MDEKALGPLSMTFPISILTSPLALVVGVSVSE
jgi:hypothetical protein